MFPILNPPPTSLPIPSLWVIPVYQPQALVSCIEPRLAIHFLYDITHVSMSFSQIIPPSSSPRKNEGMEPKQKQYPVVDVTGDRSKIQCCKEQYCIGTWNVRSMNQGKLEVIKQEMARVNVDIPGIRKLKWTGMGEFNSDDHYIYYCGQESLRRNGVAIVINKRV